MLFIFSLFLFKYSTKEIKPPSKQKSDFFTSSSLWSSIVIFKPFVKNAISLWSECPYTSACSKAFSTEITTLNNWIPIGNYSANEDLYFSGVFDGDGHSITDLYINSESSYQGLFGYSTGIIENLNVVDVENLYVDKDGRTQENNDIYYKQVSLSKENFTNILGEDGEIKILDISGKVLNTINKDTEVNEDGNIVVNFNEKYNKLSFEKLYESTIKEYPKREIVTYDYIAESKDLPYERIESLNRIKNGNVDIIVTTVEACMQEMISGKDLYSNTIEFKFNNLFIENNILSLFEQANLYLNISSPTFRCIIA